MSKTLHKIKAHLYGNLLTDDPNDYSARVTSERSLDVTSICTSAYARGGADVSADAMQHAVELFLKEMAYLLCDGFSVNTGYFTAVPSIKGVFNSPVEAFHPGKHAVHFLFGQGEAMRRLIPSIEVEILGVAEAGCTVALVADVKSGTINELLTPGFNLKIAGNKIKLAGDNPFVGVYFRNAETAATVKVDASDIAVNNPSELIVIIPALTAGIYSVEIVTQFSGNALLKEPRTAIFDKPLYVK